MKNNNEKNKAIEGPYKISQSYQNSGCIGFSLCTIPGRQCLNLARTGAVSMVMESGRGWGCHEGPAVMLPSSLQAPEDTSSQHPPSYPGGSLLRELVSTNKHATCICGGVIHGPVLDQKEMALTRYTPCLGRAVWRHLQALATRFSGSCGLPRLTPLLSGLLLWHHLRSLVVLTSGAVF